jgi:sigma-B regulation protein RsbU (phosphoserine phosphatase)
MGRRATLTLNAASESESNAISDSRAADPPLIAIVDDDSTTVRMIEGILRRDGFRTASAGDVAGAVAEIRRQPPDLILLDIHLIGGSGFEVCRALRADPATATIPVLFLSAENDTMMKVCAFEIGGVDYITKPIAGAEVIARVRTHLRLRAYQRLSELHAERVQRLASAQKALMPTSESLPQAHFQVCLRQVLPAGGHFYDVIPAGDHVIDYFVADASGHDLAGSFWTAALKALALEYASPVNLPIDVVRAINSSLCRFLPQGAFFTLVYARLNHCTGRLSLIDAGQPPAIVVPFDGSSAYVVHQEGDLLGAHPGATFGVKELTLAVGDRLFLYSDGTLQGCGSREAAVERLREACHRNRSLPLRESLDASLAEMTQGVLPSDDIVLLGVER